MKLKLKLLAAALGLALAGGANASITIENSISTVGEMFVTVWDSGADLTSNVDDRAYVRDLGTMTATLANGGFAAGTLGNWTVGAGTSPAPVLNSAMFLTSGGTTGTVGTSPTAPIISVGPDANLSSFLANSNDVSRLRWNIVAADSYSTDRILTTASGIGADQLPTYTEFRGFAGRAGVYLAPVNAGLGANESVVLTGADAAINLWGTNFAGLARFDNSAGVGDLMNFYLLSEKVASGSTTVKATLQQFEQWRLGNDGTLVYAPVPEPGTWAMLAAGLLMIGGIARRRLS